MTASTAVPRFVPFLLVALVAGCATDRVSSPAATAPLERIPSSVASLSVHGASSPSYPEAALGSDPNPSNPGLWLGYDVTPNSCFRDLNPSAWPSRADTDNDWLFDDCEFKIASGFRPFLVTSNYCMGGEPTYAVKYFYYPPQNRRYVRIMYMLSYYDDCGYFYYGEPHSGPGDGERIQLNVAFDGTSHWLFHSMSMSRHGSLPYYDWMNGLVTYGGSSNAPWRGYPNVWVSSGKHGNFLNLANCHSNWSISPDSCVASGGGRVNVLMGRNVGEVRHDESTSPMDPGNPQACFASVSRPETGRIECYLTRQPFNGWYAGNPTGGTYFDDLKNEYSKFYEYVGFGPNPPPPIIYISGPGGLAPYETYTWSAEVNAVAPASLQWYVDGAPVETSSSISRSFGPNETHSLQVVVSAGDGTSGSAVIYVQTTGSCPAGGSKCEEWFNIQGRGSAAPKPLTPRKGTVPVRRGTGS